MLLYMCIVALLVTAIALLIRFIACLPNRARKHGLHTKTEDASAAEGKARSAAKRRGHGPNSTFVTAVVLGSGGHTSEMLQLLQTLPLDTYGPLHYIIAATDTSSLSRIPEAQRSSGLCHVYTLPRSREVGQSWLSTVWTSLLAVRSAAVLVWKLSPDLLLVNGPVQLPLISCAAVAAAVGCGHLESYRFIVHWPELLLQYPRAEYLGQLC
eukprot:17136-Heterococcus_DN1.PRE.8